MARVHERMNMGETVPEPLPLRIFSWAARFSCSSARRAALEAALVLELQRRDREDREGMRKMRMTLGLLVDDFARL